MEVPIRASDRTWLLMDRPNNLMYTNGVMWFSEQLDHQDVLQVLQERLVDRFPVFHRRAREVNGSWVWQDDPDFSLDRHVRRVALDAPSDLAVAREYASRRVSEPLDPDHPLWEFDLVENVEGIDGGTGSVLLARFHHGIADGVRLVQVLLSLCDVEDEAVGEAVPDRVGRRSSGRSPSQRVVATAKRAITDAADVAMSVGGAAVRLPRAAVSSLSLESFEQGLDLVRDPHRAVDAFSTLMSESNMTTNTLRSAGRLTLAGRSVDTVWSGEPGVDKHVSWIAGIDLDAVKEMGRSRGATVNDVLLAVVSRGLTDYLRKHGEHEVDEVRWLVPVSLKPIDANLSEDLGNHFAVVMLPLPLGVDDPTQLLDEVRSRMLRIKNSAEPMMVFGLQRAAASLPQTLATELTNFVANKTVGQLTNVPGPRAPMSLAGTRVQGVLGWVPTSGDQPLGICIFSYNGRVSIGFIADQGLVPDLETLCDLTRNAFESLHHQLVGGPLPADAVGRATTTSARPARSR